MSTSVHSKPFDQELPTWAANMTSLPVRISRYNDIANQESQKLMGTWKWAGLPTQSVDCQEYLGTAERYHGLSLLVPEVPPQRIPDAVKLVDLVCVLDNLQDVRGRSSWRAKVATMRIATSIVIRRPLSVIDLLRNCVPYLQSLRSFSPVFPSTKHSFAKLFPIRLYDLACSLSMQTLSFVLGLKLSTRDAGRLQCLNLVSSAAIALSNDILSWPKEKVERVSSKKDPCSSMTIFLRQPGCDERRALLQCRRKLKQFETKATLLAEELLADTSISLNVKKMTQSYLLLISGVALWSCVSKRYSSKGPTADLVREVLEIQLPPVILDKDFEAEYEIITEGYMSIYRKYF